MNDILLIEQAHATATLSLNRPAVGNALNDALIQALITTLQQLEKDPDVRVVCLRGTGRHFCAGGDLAWMYHMANAAMAENLADARQLAALMHMLYHFSKPVIAAVQGAAYGGALGLIACCDIVLASDEASFCFSEARIGLVPAVISPYIIRAIGERAARRYFLSAEPFNAHQAQNLGLVHEIVSKQALAGTTAKLIEKLLQNSPAALNRIKQLFAPVALTEIEESVHKLAEARASAEGQEGLRAFLEKRTPNWQQIFKTGG